MTSIYDVAPKKQWQAPLDRLTAQLSKMDERSWSRPAGGVTFGADTKGSSRNEGS